MDSIWTVLGLKPTQDVSAIKRAYAQKTHACHPEENPEGFLELRKAYQAALDYAERGTAGFAGLTGESGTGGADAPRSNAGGTDVVRSNAGEADATGSNTGGADTAGSNAEEADIDGLNSGEAEDEGWTLTDNPKYAANTNPYTDHRAIRDFLELYTGKQRKDQKKWLDYFTSDAFLDVAWDRRFTALLLERIIELEKEYPVNREFLIWLCVAYQFTVHRAVYRNPDGSERTEFQFQIRAGAHFQNCTGTQFEGQDSVFEIATKGPAPRYPRGNEWAVSESFREYRRLLSMAEKDVWSEQETGEYSEIIGHYAAIYITDKCQQRGDMDYERHPAGLRLMTHFLRRDGLPEELYRIAWQRLNLETAVMGREKIFYGSMRELILERMPERSGQQR